MAVAAAVIVPAAAAGSPAATKGVRCGSKQLYGKSLRVYVVGTPIPCSRVAAIIRGRCRAGKGWSCFSVHPPGPVLFWFRERERFKDEWSTVIEARRAPCGESRVTAEAWTTRDRSDAFPSRRQVLADDLVRCRQLRGQTYAQVVALLGAPDETDVSHGKRHAHWGIGNERDSFFQVDSESLSVTFGRDGRLASISFAQG